MSHPANNGTAPRRLNVGIYGCPQAGKTRFLYQLLSGWHKGHRLLSCSPNCQTFLATVEEELETHGRSSRTAAKTEGLVVEVRRDGKLPPWHLTLRDLQGEVLADEVDDLAKNLADGVIPEQVRQCDAFLFFFDPTSSSDQSHIDEHYRRELRRVELFIDYVLRTRQNEHLPVVFVVTRLDLWEDDRFVRARADLWLNQVNDILKSRYQEVLLAHHPEALTEQAGTSFAVSSVRGHDGEKVIRQLEDLVEQTEAFAKQGRRGLGWLLAAGGAVAGLLLVALAVVLLFASGFGGPAEKVRRELDALDQVLAAPPSLEQATQINRALIDLPEKLSATPPLPDALQERLRETLGKTAALVRQKAEGQSDEPLESRLAWMTACLDNVPAAESPELAATQSAYWGLMRQQVVGQLAGLLKQKKVTLAAPPAALHEVILELELVEKRIKESKVSPPEARQALLDEVRTAAGFCENRKADAGYRAKLRVVSAVLKSDKFSPNRRRITFESPKQEPKHFDLQSEPVSATELRLKASDKPAVVIISLGESPGRLIGSVHGGAGDVWVDHSLEWAAGSEGATLRILGMPLVRRTSEPLRKEARGAGYEVTVEFTELPAAPALLADAVGGPTGGTKP